jgi:hypothetical protein
MSICTQVINWIYNCNCDIITQVIFTVTDIYNCRIKRKQRKHQVDWQSWADTPREGQLFWGLRVPLKKSEGGSASWSWVGIELDTSLLQYFDWSPMPAKLHSFFMLGSIASLFRFSSVVPISKDHNKARFLGPCAYLATVPGHHTSMFSEDHREFLN